MSGEYVLVKVFDLSQAPRELRDADDLAALRPTSGPSEPAILSLTVGRFEPGQPGVDPSREITYAEFQLHRWLEDSGAARGETVLVRWDGMLLGG